MLFLLLQMIPQFSALIAIFVLSQLLGLINSAVDQPQQLRQHENRDQRRKLRDHL